tara:strand:+ start:58 stop:348 length:291 start_codon:yes stop_codon:yes gene_type:complete
MYPPQSYDLPPINPAAFGGLPQEAQRSGAPPLVSPSGGQPQPPQMDMNKYLMDKVEGMRQRTGGEEMGALSSFSSAMQPPVQGPPVPMPQQPPMRA